MMLRRALLKFAVGLTGAVLLGPAMRDRHGVQCFTKFQDFVDATPPYWLPLSTPISEVGGYTAPYDG